LRGGRGGRAASTPAAGRAGGAAAKAQCAVTATTIVTIQSSMRALSMPIKAYQNMQRWLNGAHDTSSGTTDKDPVGRVWKALLSIENQEKGVCTKPVRVQLHHLPSPSKLDTKRPP
jgi:hypothetical protein